jgi:sigma-B regulation protein RsbU (phosphoserine phosphatase)
MYCRTWRSAGRYTDGVIEALNSRGEQWGKQSFETLLGCCCHQAPEAIVNTVLRELNAFIGEAPQQDDITIAVVRLNRRCAA